MRIGPFDPIILVLNVINTLIKKGVITVLEAKEIIKGSLPFDMPEEEKEKFVNYLFV